ncbi:MAG: glycoside hydrolase family 32 protein [Leadbetterella sp.]|nr:glycoside hydrolase family 32 protein [Leadbetterella sp.]
MNRYISLFSLLLLAGNVALAQEPYRPAFHFSPKKGWMNDPNGMFYQEGVYHLFFQHYPDKTKWGPMHWGHATSPDMIHWTEQPIALFPDKLGYIFSGSAVVDYNNTSGFGKDGKTPVVAIYTNHSAEGEKAKRTDYQTQGIAYSLDNGRTWTKYEGNPVIKNPGIVDFRDPKVSWYAPKNKWVMALATKDRITFYSSANLKDWTRESDLGHDFGAHGGVWECPDLMPFELNGKTYWVLLVSINPGGPNGGSATQYFVGDFDGSTFRPLDTQERWMDYGTDNYAGVTFFHKGKRTLLMGWMSNWQYAQDVPTVDFRSAMTLPREMGLQQVNGTFYLTSTPAKEVETLWEAPRNVKNAGTFETATKGLFDLEFKGLPNESFSVALSNSLNEVLVIGYDKPSGRYFIDRSAAGKKDFEAGFAKRQWGPRVSAQSKIDLRIIADRASVEVFADGGLTVMTALCFPNQPYSHIQLKTEKKTRVANIRYAAMKPAKVH